MLYEVITQVHTVGGVMINVMGKQVQGPEAVVDIAMTLGTVAGGPAVLQSYNFV